jgi:hypothetical protein
MSAAHPKDGVSQATRGQASQFPHVHNPKSFSAAVTNFLKG